MANTQQDTTVEAVRIREAGLTLDGDLGVPADVRGVILFAHGNGSGRLAPRNRAVAEVLNRHGFATLLLDLLTEEEEALEAHTGHLRFDIELLAERLTMAAVWLAAVPEVRGVKMGLCGGGTGAAAALVAAAARPNAISAVVCRGGRPDLAGNALRLVQSPTLLIVGEHDPAVLELNHQAFDKLRCLKRIQVVPGAGHLFTEPGALDTVARMTGHWFIQHLLPAPTERVTVQHHHRGA